MRKEETIHSSACKTLKIFEILLFFVVMAKVNCKSISEECKKVKGKEEEEDDEEEK